MTTETKEIVTANGMRFTVGSVPMRRFSAVQTVSNLSASTSLQPIQLPATGFVRALNIYVTASYTTSASAAVVAGDAPWNLLTDITLTDATGNPIVQPVSGYGLYLFNKYFGSGGYKHNTSYFSYNPHVGPDYAFAASSTSGSATFRLRIDLEQDRNNGYGCIPNLDSNASLQFRANVAAHSVAFSGGTASAASVTVRIEQEYWAPVGNSIGGVTLANEPVGLGDYVAWLYDTQTVSASTENLVTLTNRGGLIKGLMVVSRASGTRTAFTSGSNVGLLLDNTPIDEGVTLLSHLDRTRRTYGYYGADLTTSYAPLTAGVMPGADSGVLVWPFCHEAGGRDSWLATRTGSLLQLKVTPGSSATTLEIYTLLGNVRDSAAFYGSSSLN